MIENEKNLKKRKFNVKAICVTAVMAALIFVFTYTFKIPLGTGYTHLGDVMIFLSLLLLGSKKSCFAAGVGAALADLIGGYAQWVVPTFFIKLIMVMICGLFTEKFIKNKTIGYVVGAVLGGLFQIGAYTAVKVVLFDKAYALTTFPELALQTAVGIVVAIVIITIFNKTKVTGKLRKMAQ